MQVGWLAIKCVMQILMSVIRQKIYSKIYTKVRGNPAYKIRGLTRFVLTFGSCIRTSPRFLYNPVPASQSTESRTNALTISPHLFL